MNYKKRLFRLYIEYKIKFDRPIYRVDILRYVKYIEHRFGLCNSIHFALFRCNIHVPAAIEPTVSRFFPLMLRKKRRAL